MSRSLLCCRTTQLSRAKGKEPRVSLGPRNYGFHLFLRTRTSGKPAQAQVLISKTSFSVKAAAEVIDVTPDTSTNSDAPGETSKAFALVCPICHTTQFPVPSTLGGQEQQLSCSRCARQFEGNDEFWDLTLTSGVQYKSYQKQPWLGTTTFESPIVSFVYERGWRQGFSWAGFPGVEKEFSMAMDFLRGAQGEVLVDMSCGSGLFTRKFAASGKFPLVVAADFSENMLRQTRSFLREDRSVDPSAVRLVRADICRLPFATGSVPAVHAGAAIHCWPEPQLALAEISRVLAPGGVFVASTFLNFYAPLGQVVGDDVLRPLKQLEPFQGRTTAYRWWEEEELRDICRAVGLEGFERNRDQRFIMFSVRKPLG